MQSILRNGVEYREYNYETEKEFEKDIVANAKSIFGKNTYYIDVKKLLRGRARSGSIPDGYLLDCTTQTKPKLYLIENELKSHSIKDHIAPQLVQFYFNYRSNFLEIKNLIIKYLNDNNVDIDEIARHAGYRNADDMLTNIIYNGRLGVIIPIDEVNADMEELKNMFRFDLQLLSFKKYVNGDDTIYSYDTFYSEAEERTTELVRGELDTVIVPADEEGFKEEFLGNNRWYAVNIGINMLDKIKYLAVYQNAPVKAITHYAEVATIELYGDTGKYILYFKGEGKELENVIPLNPNNPNKAPQNRVYTNIQTILNANPGTTLDDIF